MSSESSPSTKPVVFITGCTSGGIGAALANTLATRGCIVYASARKLTSMDSLTHANIRKLVVDVTSDESVKAAVEEIYAKETKLDVLLSNAGLPGTMPLLDISLEDAKAILDTNFIAFIRLTQLIVPRMAAAKKGLVVAIGSILGEIGTPWTGMYNASKAALHSYTETLQMECRPLGVDIMLVAPGSVISNIANNASKSYNPPPNSLYTSFQKSITHVMFQSQTREYGAMPNATFASQLCSYILASDGKLRKNPTRYVSLGGSKWLWVALKWLPRTMAYDMIWNDLSKRG